MFTKVVVGVDGFRSDRDAVAAAGAIAPGAEVDLTMVYADAGTPLREGLDAYREMIRDDVLQRLTDLRTKAELPRAAVHAVPDYSPSRGLKRHARETGADLIVLGASHQGPLGRAVLGDFARGVLHGAPCPVLNVARSHHAAGTTPRSIGVAFDSSPEASHALDLAVGLARQLVARLEIVEALEVGVVPAVWGIQIAEYLDGLVAPEQERLDALAAVASSARVRDGEPWIGRARPAWSVQPRRPHGVRVSILGAAWADRVRQHGRPARAPLALPGPGGAAQQRS